MPHHSPTRPATDSPAPETGPCCGGCTATGSAGIVPSGTQEQSGTTRRRALAGAGVLAGTAAVLTACGTDGDQKNDQALDHPVDIAAADDVPVGGAIAAAAEGTSALLTQPTEGDFKAFSTVCTHQGCTVTVRDSTLVCPCHSSVFSIEDGSVQSGPATQALPEYATEVKDGRITISS